jgi:glycosyl-4,4'-diaponeurosporenoate acyltransferase
MEGPHREHPLMALPPGLGEGLACGALWLGWSLLVGAAANQLPLPWLAHPAAERSQGEAATVLRRYESCLLIRRWKPWIPDAGHVLPGGIHKASLMGRDRAGLERLLAETRRAELVHWALWPAWLVTALWLPPRGVVLNLVFATCFNLPCLLLQRYNRLRVGKLLQALP